ncbi:MAG TPA: TonB-dependent receptor [Terriglobia bacterium]|nr:TonB-dependent receptor [Terriglobia bacterium]
MPYRIARLLFLLIISGAGMLAAQITTGSIYGTVKDTTGAVLPGASVTVVNEETGVSRTVPTDAMGRYVAPSLNPGRYRVTASLTGFQTMVRSGIEITVGRQAAVNFDLQVGSIAQSVEVTAEAPLVSTVGGTIGDTIESSEISELPLNGRDLAQLVTLQTGVVNYNEASTDGQGKLLVVSGARATANVFYMDGIAIESFASKTPTGVSGNFLGSESVREFKVDSNAYSAEYGRGAGGIFNISTKSGGNTFHGSLFEYLRNDNLDAAQWEDNAFAGEKPEFKRNQFGGSLGGPIRRDKTFFFFNYEGYRERQDSTRVSTTFGDALRAGDLNGDGINEQPIDPRVQPYLAFWPRPNGALHADGTGDFIGNNPVPTDEDYLQGRIDHSFSESDQAYVRYTFNDSERHTLDPFPGEGGMIFTGRNQYVTVEDKHIFSPNFLGMVRAGFTRTAPFEEPENRREIPLNLRFNPVFPYLGSLSTGSGITGIGVGESGDSRKITSYQLASDFVYNKGRNVFKFGVMWIRINFNAFQPARDAGNYSFSNVRNFYRVVVNRFRGSVFDCCDDPYRSIKQNVLGLYFQDELRLTPRLTLTPGLRYEIMTVPHEKWGRVGNFNGDLAFFWRATQNDITTGNPWVQNPSLKDFAPRIGLAWDVFGDGRMAVRSGFGLFFSHLDQTWIRTTAFRMPPFLIEVEGRGSAIQFPNMFSICSQDNPITPVDSRCNIAAPVPNWLPEKFSDPYVMQYNVNVEKQLGADFLVKVGFAGSRGVRLASISDVNTQVGQEINGRLVFPSSPVCRGSRCRPNLNFDRMRYRHPMANSWYNALQVNATKRLSQGVQFSASYTFAKNLDEISGSQTASDTDTGVQTSYYPDRTLYKGLSAFDAKNVFTFSGTYELPVGQGRRFGSGLGGIAEGILGGWEVGGILTLRSGFPFTVSRGGRTALGNMGIADEVPDLLPGASNNPTEGTTAGCAGFAAARPGAELGTPELWYDPCVFVEPPSVLTFGNLGRNTLRLPGLATVDFTLGKNFRITEGSQLQFRFEAYNFFNRPNFRLPSGNMEVFDDDAVANPTAGRIESSNPARQIQFGLKYTF